jgi:hypothetical protein
MSQTPKTFRIVSFLAAGLALVAHLSTNIDVVEVQSFSFRSNFTKGKKGVVSPDVATKYKAPESELAPVSEVDEHTRDDLSETGLTTNEQNDEAQAAVNKNLFTTTARLLAMRLWRSTCNSVSKWRPRGPMPDAKSLVDCYDLNHLGLKIR